MQVAASAELKTAEEKAAGFLVTIATFQELATPLKDSKHKVVFFL